MDPGLHRVKHHNDGRRYARDRRLPDRLDVQGRRLEMSQVVGHFVGMIGQLVLSPVGGLERTAPPPRHPAWVEIGVHEMTAWNEHAFRQLIAWP